MRQDTKEDKLTRKHDHVCFCEDQVKYLVVSEKIDVIIDAARRFLGVSGVSGEVVQQHLREAFRLSQTQGK